MSVCYVITPLYLNKWETSSSFNVYLSMKVLFFFFSFLTLFSFQLHRKLQNVWIFFLMKFNFKILINLIFVIILNVNNSISIVI
jgi:hypothetical protein